MSKGSAGTVRAEFTLWSLSICYQVAPPTRAPTLFLPQSSTAQAIKRPAYTALLAPNARIIGYVRAAAGAAADTEAAGPEAATTPDSRSAAALAAADKGSGGAAGSASWIQPGGQPAGAAVASAAVQEREQEGQEPEEQEWDREGEQAALGGVAMSASTRLRMRRTRLSTGPPTAATDTGTDSNSLSSPGDSSPPRPYQGSPGRGAGAGSSGAGGKGLAPRARKPQDQIWMVPAAMERIWEKLARAAGGKAAAGDMGGEHIAKWVMCGVCGGEATRSGWWSGIEWPWRQGLRGGGGSGG